MARELAWPIALLSWLIQGAGIVRLQGLELKTEVLEALPLPVRCIGGSLGEVRVTVPWRNLLGDEPMVLSIDRVLLLLAPRSDEPEEEAEAAKPEAISALARVSGSSTHMGPSRRYCWRPAASSRFHLALLSQRCPQSPVLHLGHHHLGSIKRSSAQQPSSGPFFDALGMGAQAREAQQRSLSSSNLPSETV